MTIKKSRAKQRKSNGAKKRKYSRSTPIGRLARRFERALNLVEFSIERMGNWPVENEPDLAKAMGAAQQAKVYLSESLEATVRMTEANWTPPKKSLAVYYTTGDLVAILPKYRIKYRELYTTEQMNNLMVVKTLETGEIVVRADIVSPPVQFFAVKSHLKRREASKKNGHDAKVEKVEESVAL